MPAIWACLPDQDDILDVTGDEAETGKHRQGRCREKATFVSLLGLEGAGQDKARKLIRAESARLNPMATRRRTGQLARFVIERDA